MGYNSVADVCNGIVAETLRLYLHSFNRCSLLAPKFAK